MLSGRGLCDELITRPEESYRMWSVVACVLENLKNEEVMTRVGSQRHSKNKMVKVKCTLVLALRLCTGRTAYGGSRGIALLFHDHGSRRG